MNRVRKTFLAALAVASVAYGQPGSGPISGGGGGGGVSGLTACNAGTALSDNALLRSDGTDKCQGSLVSLNDTGGFDFEGATADAFEGAFTFADPTADWTWAWSATGALAGPQLNIDNLRLDGNTLSSTNTNGNIVLDPNGTGIIPLGGTANSDAALRSLGSSGGLEVRTGDDLYYQTLKAGDVVSYAFDAGSNVSISGLNQSITPSTGTLRVVGTIQLADPGSKPTCDSGTSGRHWYDQGGAGVADTYEICMKDAADAYAWVALATP